MNPHDDGYASEVIKVVTNLSREVEQARQDVNRSVLPLFQRIVGIEKRLDEENKDRPARQQQLDARLNKQDKALEVIASRLTVQDGALGNQDQTLAAQDTVLKDISKWQRWRTLAELVVILIVIIWLAWPK